MRLKEFRQAVVDGLRANIPELLDVSPHGGRFDLEELKRFSVKSPAARVAFMGMKRMELQDTGRLTGPASMIVYIVTRNKNADEQALDIAEKIAALISEATWGMKWIEAAHVTDLDNLYSSQIDNQGIALWAVAFTQAIAFGPSLEEVAPNAADFLENLQSFPEAVHIHGPNGDVMDFPKQDIEDGKTFGEPPPHSPFLPTYR
jgi:phage gp37-like protein